MEGFVLPIDIVISVIWIVGITNAINIIDGLDDWQVVFHLLPLRPFQ